MDNVEEAAADGAMGVREDVRDVVNVLEEEEGGKEDDDNPINIFKDKTTTCVC